MNKELTGVICGFIAGAAVGGFGAWAVTKNVMERRADEEIADLREHYRKKMKESAAEQPAEEKEETEESNDEESHRENPEDKIDKNAGVKRYWHPITKDPLDEKFDEAVDEIKKGARDMTENERGAELDPSLDPVPGISEITSDEYSIDQGYKKLSFEYFCGDDRLFVTNSDGTLGEDADKWFRTEYHADVREEVTGKFLRWAPDYIEENEDTGWIYIRNETLKLDLEITVYDRDYLEVIDEETGEKLNPNGDIKDNE